VKTETIASYGVTTEPLQACVNTVCEWMKSVGPTRTIICLNPHSVITAGHDSVFEDVLHDADILLPDGAGIVLASRMLGGTIRRRITGSDIFAAINATLNEQGGTSCFFLGSTPAVTKAIVNRMDRDYPHVRVAGTYSPPFRTEFTEEDDRAMLAAVNAMRPDILWVGMTQPKQEKWIHRNRHLICAKAAIAVGAVFDFYGGRIKRSPLVFQRLGLEWLPRLMREPRRLWRRNLNGFRFIFRILLEAIASHVRKSPQVRDPSGH